MKKKSLSSRIPLFVGICVVILAIIGIYRRYGANQSTLALEYTRPGGDTLAVAIEMSPLTYNLSNDTAAGFDYEILSSIARQHGLKLKFEPVAGLEKAFQDLYDGQYDLFIGNIPSTARIKEYFPVTDAIYFDRQVLVQRADSIGGKGPISSQTQLMGDTVWLAEASPFKLRLNNLAHELGDTIYTRSEPGITSEHLVSLTAHGEVDKSVVSQAVARRMAHEYPQLDFSTPISFSQLQVWVVAPGDSTLLDSLNTWIADFKTTPAFNALEEKYLK